MHIRKKNTGLSKNYMTIDPQLRRIFEAMSLEQLRWYIPKTFRNRMSSDRYYLIRWAIIFFCQKHKISRYTKIPLRRGK